MFKKDQRVPFHVSVANCTGTGSSPSGKKVYVLVNQ